MDWVGSLSDGDVPVVGSVDEGGDGHALENTHAEEEGWPGQLFLVEMDVGIFGRVPVVVVVIIVWNEETQQVSSEKDRYIDSSRSLVP